MKSYTVIKTTPILLTLVLFLISGCELVAGIFKAGVWTGLLMVVGVIALIIYLISKKRN